MGNVRGATNQCYAFTMTSDVRNSSVEELMNALYLKLETQNDGFVSVDGNLV